MASANYFLCSFSPLCSKPMGLEAIRNHGHPPFIDGSCRREPDLENKAPAISALCRAGKFAPRLKPGDGVVYIGKKRKYPGLSSGRWPLVAVLKVVERFDNHEAAASWYRLKGLKLPRNCMVDENPPLGLDHTSGPKEWGCLDESKPREVIADWDKKYKKRAKDCGTFLACKALCLCLEAPLMLDDERMRKIMGKIPGTQNPPAIEQEQFDRFLEMARKA